MSLLSHARSLTQLWRSPLVSRVLWVGGGQAALALLGLASLRLLTELATPGVFGEASLLITAITLGMNVLVAPVQNTQLRYHTQFAAEGRDAAFSGWMLRRAFLGSALVSALAVLILFWMPTGIGATSFTLTALAVAWAPVVTLRNALMARAGAEQDQRSMSIWQVAEAIFALAATVAALRHSPTTNGYVTGQLAGPLFISVLVLGFSNRARRIDLSVRDPSAAAQVDRLIVSYGLPFVGLAVLNWIANLIDRYLLGAFLDAAAVGHYVAAFAIASRMQLLAGGVTAGAFRPALFDAENAGRLEQARQLFVIWTSMVIASAAAIIALVWILAPWLAETLLAPAFRPNAAPIMNWIALGYGISAVTGVLENRIMSYGMSAKLGWPMGIGAAASVAFGLALIPMNGAVGAAQASAASFALQLAATWLVLRGLSVSRSSHQGVKE